MGEKSKQRGEFGEDIVSDFLVNIGWEDCIKNRDIECSKNIEHSISTKDRKDHGIDFIYHYDCSLISDTQNFILLSSKYTEKYPSNPQYNFKSYVRDLAYAIECFSKSTLKSKLANNQYGFKHKIYGVILWLDSNNIFDDLIDRLSDFKVDSDLEFEALYLVDNKRINFLTESIEFTKRRFPNAIIEFLLPTTGYNSTAKTRVTSTNVMPVQYINSSVLPIKIIDNDREFLLISSIDEIEEDYLRKIVNLSHKLSEGWGNQVYLLFPEFNNDKHREMVQDIKLEFSDKRFIKKVNVSSYDPNFRNIEL